MTKKSLELSFLLFLIFAICVSEVYTKDVETDSSLIIQAEDMTFSAYEKILEAESLGADIKNLTLSLNLATSLLEKAKFQNDIGNLTAMMELAQGSLSISSNIVVEADKLTNLTVKENSQFLWFTLLLGSVLSAIICFAGSVVWCFYTRHNAKKILNMKLDDFRALIIFLCLVLILAAFSPFIVLIYPVKSGEQPFLALGLLGKDRKLGDYYPNGNSTIQAHSIVQWYIYINNRMHSAKYVEVRVKLINTTHLFPDSQKCLSSSAKSLFEFRRILLNGEEQNLPFFWQIIETKDEGDKTVITQLEINNMTIDLDVGSLLGKDLYMVFELWVYNENSGNFEFAWNSNQVDYCAWNEIWFNVLAS